MIPREKTWRQLDLVGVFSEEEKLRVSKTEEFS